MSKGKNVVKSDKKAPSTEGKKAPSDYQSGKGSASSTEPIINNKKKK